FSRLAGCRRFVQPCRLSITAQRFKRQLVLLGKYGGEFEAPVLIGARDCYVLPKWDFYLHCCVRDGSTSGIHDATGIRTLLISSFTGVWPSENARYQPHDE